jgi:hypothetical protein
MIFAPGVDFKLEETLTPLAVFYLLTRMFLETPAASSSVIESSKS